MPIVDRKENLAGLEPNAIKVALIILFAVSLTVLTWYMINIAKVSDQASKYVAIGSLGLIIMVLFIASAIWLKMPLPVPILFERNIIRNIELPQWLKVIAFYALPAIIGILFFFLVGNNPSYQLVGTPSYQIVEITPEITFVLTLMSSIQEDLFFWSILLPLHWFLWMVLLRFLKIPHAFWVACIIVLFLHPFIFTLFHFLRYGFTDAVNSNNVYMMGWLWTLWTMVTGNILLPLFMHGGSNSGIQYWIATKGSLPVFPLYILIFLVVVATTVYILRFRNRG